MKTTLVLQEWINSGEIPPSKFYVKNLYGDYIFLHTDVMKEAHEWALSKYPHSKLESSKLAHITK